MSTISNILANIINLNLAFHVYGITSFKKMSMNFYNTFNKQIISFSYKSNLR